MCSSQYKRYFCCFICCFLKGVDKDFFKKFLDLKEFSALLNSKGEEGAEIFISELLLFLCLPYWLVVQRNALGDFEISYIDKVCFKNLRSNELPEIKYKKDGQEVLLSGKYAKYHQMLIKIALQLRSSTWKKIFEKVWSLLIWYSKKRSQKTWSSTSFEGRIGDMIDDFIAVKIDQAKNGNLPKISNLLNKIVHFGDQKKDVWLKENRVKQDCAERKNLLKVILLVISNFSIDSTPSSQQKIGRQEGITLPEEPLLKLFCQLIGEEIVDNHLKPAVKDIIHEDLIPVTKELMEDFKKSDTGKSFNNLKNILLNFQVRASFLYCWYSWFYIGGGGTLNLRKDGAVFLCSGGILSKDYLFILKKMYIEMILIEAICLDHTIINFDQWNGAFSLNIFILFSFFKYQSFYLALGGGVQKLNSGFKITIFYMGGEHTQSVSV